MVRVVLSTSEEAVLVHIMSSSYYPVVHMSRIATVLVHSLRNTTVCARSEDRSNEIDQSQDIAGIRQQIMGTSPTLRILLRLPTNPRD